MKACHLRNDRAWNKLPIRNSVLQLILMSLNTILDDQPYLLTLYRALFTTAYFGLFRIGELSCSDHAVKACDVHIGKNKKKLFFVLHSSKRHGKVSKPQIVKIKAHECKTQGAHIPIRKMHAGICPFTMLRSYLKIRKNYVDSTEQFFVLRDRSPVTQYQIRVMLAKSISLAKLEPINYSFQGF